VVALGSLASLVIVAGVREADVLAVVALSLAILAFAIQIIVFMAQASSTSQQVSQAQRVNADTRALLSELQTQTRDTNAALTDQYDKLLDRLLLVAKEAGSDTGASEGGATLAEVQERLLEEIQRSRQIPERAGPRLVLADTRGRSTPPPREWPASSTIRRLEEMGLANLGLAGRTELAAFASDWALSVDRDMPDGLSRDPDSPGIHDLLAMGLVRQPAGSYDDRAQYFVLTAAGRDAARLLLAPPPVPRNVPSLFPWVPVARKRLDPR
jgi:hypothetical protein